MYTVLLVLGVPVLVFIVVVVAASILDFKSDLDSENKSLIRKGLERANEDKSK